MCVYYVCGDMMWKWNPPSNPYPSYVPPLIPQPAVPPVPWSLEQLREYRDLLQQIKDLEDQVGCPCPEARAKPDYLKIIKDMIAAEEAKRDGA